MLYNLSPLERGGCSNAPTPGSKSWGKKAEENSPILVNKSTFDSWIGHRCLPKTPWVDVVWVTNPISTRLQDAFMPVVIRSTTMSLQNTSVVIAMQTASEWVRSCDSAAPLGMLPDMTVAEAKAYTEIKYAVTHILVPAYFGVESFGTNFEGKFKASRAGKYVKALFAYDESGMASAERVMVTLRGAIVPSVQARMKMRVQFRMLAAQVASKYGVSLATAKWLVENAM